MQEKELRHLNIGAAKKSEIPEEIKNLVSMILELTPNEKVKQTLCYITMCFKDFFNNVEEIQEAEMPKTEVSDEQIYEIVATSAVLDMPFLNKNPSESVMMIDLIYIIHADMIDKYPDFMYNPESFQKAVDYINSSHIARQITMRRDVSYEEAGTFVRTTNGKLNDWLYAKGFFKWPIFADARTFIFFEKYLKENVEILKAKEAKRLKETRAKKVANQQAEKFAEELLRKVLAEFD